MNSRYTAGVLALSVILGLVSLGVVPVNNKPLFARRIQDLEELGPEAIESYFNAGEYLGAIAETDQELLFASQTLSIGIGLAQRQGDGPLGASMCIALASIEQDHSMSTLLWDFALLLDPDRYSAWLDYREVFKREQMVLRREAAECLYAIRFSDHKSAASLWGRNEIRQTVNDAARRSGVDPNRFHRSITEMIRAAGDDGCRGRVFVAQRDKDKIRRVVCQEHARPIGTCVSDEVLKSFIRVEAFLLDPHFAFLSTNRWGINEYFEISEPARDPSFEIIKEHYRIDLSKPYWKNRRWSPSP